MPNAPQRRAAVTLRATRGLSEETQGRRYSPEYKESAQYAHEVQTLGSRRKAFERSASSHAMRSPLKGVDDLAGHYESMGWRDIEHEHAAAAPSMHSFEHLAEHGHNPFPLPTRWEELSPGEQARAHAGLKAHGTSITKMSRDLGRGLDRAYSRAAEMGAIPFASNFYEPKGFARQHLEHAMEGAPPEHQAAAISMTSPKNKFIHITGTGAVNMPNVNAAVVAGRLAYGGRHTRAEQFAAISGQQMNKMGREVSGGGVGLHGNVRKAAYGLHQGREGAEIHEWKGLPSKTFPEGNPIFGAAPKTSPFASSFVDTAAPFNVADIHMAGIAFPHLSGLKGSGVNINPSGAETGSKSEREIAMERIPHSHAAMDYAMRLSMAERGLSKTRFQQGAAWGEQQIHRTLHPEPGSRALGYHPATVYGWQAQTMPHTSFTRRTKRGVGSLYLPD